ncbi:MAG: type III PLP-dependent enzyme [Candidatus Zixiibacteriota bacterium]|nr:MAG: type III PLP-dependent enzyme [candidate division Zixibacteria bacterium]
MIKAINIIGTTRRAATRGLSFTRVNDLLLGAGFPTPLLVLSRSGVRRNIEQLRRALPAAAIHYAIKANNHPVILEEIAKAGGCFDISSYQELRSAVEAGARAGEMIHSHPIKSPREIADAVGEGVTLFVIDNPSEIEKFIPYAGRVRLMIRFKVDGGSAVVNLSYKFGCSEDEIVPLGIRMRELGIDYHGLAFHVGSQCTKSEVYVKAIKTAARQIRILENLGFTTRLLDIGGGFPVEYTQAVPPIRKFCEPIRNALRRHIDPGIAIACEPGRYISATTTTLVASIIGKSTRSGKNWYFLDDGLYGSFSGRLYDHCQYQTLTNRNTTWKRSVLAGPTCDSFDVIYKDILLPPLDIGDVLLFPAMGAYCSVSASSFNCLRKAEYVVIE